MIHFVCDVCGTTVIPDDADAVAYMDLGHVKEDNNFITSDMIPKYRVYLCYDCMCKINSTIIGMGWKPNKQEESNAKE